MRVIALDRILVAYASWCGSTAEVAEAVAQVLREDGDMVEVRPAREVEDVGPYKAVVIGSAARIGKLMPDSVNFVKRFRNGMQ